MTSLAHHPEAAIIRVQLRQNLVLKDMPAAVWDELDPMLEIADYTKGSARDDPALRRRE